MFFKNYVSISFLIIQSAGAGLAAKAGWLLKHGKSCSSQRCHHVTLKNFKCTLPMAARWLERMLNIMLSLQWERLCSFL